MFVSIKVRPLTVHYCSHRLFHTNLQTIHFNCFINISNIYVKYAYCRSICSLTEFIKLHLEN